ncbi:protein S100-A7 [Egretta garzetta]|uniref:protein S100-A7 n=1 Tax=Egretta garzetta TaxID=188379 RepID=UPI00163D14BE|nr:protein S100-A7 [Egretta garzetta]
MSASTQTRCTQDLPGNCTLENALKTIVDEYHRYSSQEGKMDLLSFKDFKKLMNEQAKEFLQVCNRNNSNYLRDLFEETDLNGDRELSFEEFSIVLAKLTDDAHRISHGHKRCGPDED